MKRSILKPTDGQPGKSRRLLFFLLASVLLTLAGFGLWVAYVTRSQTKHTSSSRQDSPEPQRFVAAVNGLVLRSTPTRTGTALTTIPFKTQIQVVETSKYEQIDGIEAPWLKVTAQGKTGFVFGGFLTAEPFYTEIARVANSDGSAFYLFEYDGHYDPERSCNYGPDPGCHIKIFRNGTLLYSSQGDRPIGWLDAQRLAFSTSMGECGYMSATETVYNVDQRALVEKRSLQYTENNQCGFSGESRPADRVSLTRCSFDHCTQLDIADHTAKISTPEAPVFQSTFSKHFEVDRDIRHPIRVLLDGKCWKMIELDAKVSECESS